MSGVEEPPRRGNEPARAVANAMLWPFRLVVDLIFLATGTAGGLLENEQIVPRARDFFFTRGGELGVFPTIFLETGTNPNIGVRLLASVEPYAATVRAGYGGPDENVVEARMRLGASLGGLPAVFSLEGLHDRRSGLGYLGIGQTPETDPRNQFQFGPTVGVFRERRERVVAGFGVRPLPDVEVLLSSSLAQRYVDDPVDVVGPPLSQTFVPGTVAGVLRTSRIVYSELALRLDSRTSRNGVGTGLLLEGYGGVGEGVFGEATRFDRAGFQVAAFLPVFHRSTILSPKIVVDGLIDGGGAPIPFTELPGQPTFRGFANRVDFVSAVASLDYRWYLERFLAARLFFDVARVAPSVADMTLDHLRWAGGFGFDLHTSTTELGRIAVAGSPEGFHFLFTLGVPAGFGDRQHRD